MIDPSHTDVVRRRILASLIDLAIVAGLTALVARIIAVTFIVVAETDEGAQFGTVEDYRRYQDLSSGFSRLQAFGDTWYVWDIWRLLLIGAVAVLLILLIWVVLPSRTDQSPGKAVFGLRTTDLLGETAATSQHVTRTIFGLVDILPVVAPGLLGWVLAFTSNHRQRLGDRLAQTVVIDAKAPTPRPGRTSAATAEPATEPAAPSTPADPRAAGARPAEAPTPTEVADAPIAPPTTPPVATPPVAPTAPPATDLPATDLPTTTQPATTPPVEQPSAQPVEAAAPVDQPGAAPIAAAPELFDDTAPIDIERPADDLPVRRSTLRADGTAIDGDLPDDPALEEAVPAPIVESSEAPSSNPSLDASDALAGLLAADNHADLGRPEDRRRGEPDRLDRAAWERPTAEPAPVWRRPTGGRPLIDADAGRGRTERAGDDDGYVEWNEVVVPEPVSLDFDDAPLRSPAAGGATTAATTTAATMAPTVVDHDPVADGGVTIGVPFDERTTESIDAPTPETAVAEPAPVVSEPAPVVSEPAPATPSDDPRTPTWSDAWQAWVVFDPARQAWLRHDPEQDLWLEL